MRNAMFFDLVLLRVIYGILFWRHCEAAAEAIKRHGIFHDSRIPCSLIAALAMLARNDNKI